MASGRDAPCSRGGGSSVATEARFTRFAAIDWSGATGPRQKGLALAVCAAGTQAPQLIASPERHWSRAAMLAWLRQEAAAGRPTLIGLDLSPAFPFADNGAYFPEWPPSPTDAKALWALVDDRCGDDEHLAATSFLADPQVARHFRIGNACGNLFPPGRGRLRRCEERQRDRKGLSPSSCFNLVGAAQVGKSSLTGMRVLASLDGAIPVWPFDAIPDAGPLIVEVYTTIAALDAKRPPGRSKMTTGADLDAALLEVGSDPFGHIGAIDDHRSDALLTAAWLRKVADDATLWSPAGLDDVAATEGWTFGVP